MEGSGPWPGSQPCSCLQGFAWKSNAVPHGAHMGTCFPRQAPVRQLRKIRLCPKFPPCLESSSLHRLCQLKDSGFEVLDKCTVKELWAASDSSSEKPQRFSGPVSLVYSLDPEPRRGPGRGTQGFCLLTRALCFLPQ